MNRDSVPVKGHKPENYADIHTLAEGLGDMAGVPAHRALIVLIGLIQAGNVLSGDEPPVIFEVSDDGGATWAAGDGATIDNGAVTSVMFRFDSSQYGYMIEKLHLTVDGQGDNDSGATVVTELKGLKPYTVKGQVSSGDKPRDYDQVSGPNFSLKVTCLQASVAGPVTVNLTAMAKLPDFDQLSRRAQMFLRRNGKRRERALIPGEPESADK